MNTDKLIKNCFYLLPFFILNSGLYERLFHIKRAIRMFVNLKSQLNFKHEYALMVLQETALWVLHYRTYTFNMSK